MEISALWNSSKFKLSTEIILTLGTIGFGIISSWIFGREYSDRVIQDLLALPVPRSTIVLSNFVVIFSGAFYFH
ncbi:ABC transporter permease [uncultured Methanomethylovorans sp.]|uniref:ABC transporter permease n=1 Tax=uncultured Methanomethylovorans sp. TaxID=183759 RepID=UPI003749592F